LKALDAFKLLGCTETSGLLDRSTGLLRSTTLPWAWSGVLGAVTGWPYSFWISSKLTLPSWLEAAFAAGSFGGDGLGWTTGDSFGGDGLGM